MNNAHNTILAAAVASLGGMALVRRVAAGCVVASVCTLGVAGMAHANSNDRDRDPQRSQQQSQQQSRERDRDRDRGAPPQQSRERQFDGRADEQRRQAQIQQDRNDQHSDARRGGRLTPDEKRDLRRQINEAGLDIYPNTPRR